jgi:hypothetical protein
MARGEAGSPERVNNTGGAAGLPRGGGLDVAIWDQVLPWQGSVAAPDAQPRAETISVTAPEIPPAGKQAPQVGKQAPQVGKQAPQAGRQVPLVGEQAPRRLRRVPPLRTAALADLLRRRPVLVTRAAFGTAALILVGASIVVSRDVGAAGRPAGAHAVASSGPGRSPLAGVPGVVAPDPSPSDPAFVPPPPAARPQRPPPEHAGKQGAAPPAQPLGPPAPPAGNTTVHSGGGGATSAQRGPAVVKAAPPPPAIITVSGHVTCLSGNAVEGVWVVGLHGGSGWAPWISSAAHPSYASFKKSISNGAWEVHVGCGGSPPNWKVATYSGWATGTPHDFTCDDIPGQGRYGECWT